jgi:hypothetical protein
MIVKTVDICICIISELNFHPHLLCTIYFFLILIPEFYSDAIKNLLLLFKLNSKT